MSDLPFDDPNLPIPGRLALAAAGLQARALAATDRLRLQSARQRVELETWLEEHCRPLLRLLLVIDALVDRGLAGVERLQAVAQPRVERAAQASSRAAGRGALVARARLRSWAGRADGLVAARLDDAAQHHLAHVLLTATASIAALAALAVLPVHAGDGPYVVEHLATGEVASEEALSKPPAPVAAPVPSPVEAAAPAPQPTPAPAPIAAGSKGALPTGKGMWLYLPERVEGGNVDALVARAKAVGLTHVYVRTGSSKGGFHARPYLDALLPAAHAAGIRVYGWDFPYLDDPGADVNRAMEAISYTTPSGHRIDGFSADIELRSMGVKISPETATFYGSNLRRLAGPGYPLIATVPRPSPALVTYPFAHVVEHFDAIAPMVYWLNRQPDSDVAGAVAALSVFGKPVIPIGQAYDGAAEGGRAGVPTRDELQRFMAAAELAGAHSVSFWSWQHADQQAWDAIRDAPQFTLPAAPDPLYPAQIGAYQHLLRSLGYDTTLNGQLDRQTIAAIVAFQAAVGIPRTGQVDALTRQALLTPTPPPIGPR